MGTSSGLNTANSPVSILKGPIQMIYQELVDNEYVYKVTDSKGYLIAETYSRTAAEQLEAQYRLHIHTRDYNEHKSLYKGILPQL